MIKLKSIIFEEISEREAEYIFAKYGIKNATTLSKEELNIAYKELIKHHHPDKGGKTINSQWINSAYDVLKNIGSDNINANSKSKENGCEGWAQAGWSGGMPNSSHGQDIKGNINYYKKKAWEISGKPKFSKNNEYSFYNWDGYFFRGGFIVYAIPSTLFEISQMMKEWDNWNNSTAVFFCKKQNKSLFLINLY